MDILRRWKNGINKPEGAAYLFIAPSMIILFVFALVPLIVSFGVVLFDINIFFYDTAFVGLDNFKRAFRDQRFLNALKNTIVFVVFQVPTQVGLGLLVANAVSKNTFFNKMSRTIFFIPVICSMTAIGITWSMMLDATIGLIPYGLTQLGLPTLNFFRDPDLAMGTVIVMTTWKNFGYTMSILVAGIGGIPESYYEASEIDGASKVKQFIYITLPSLTQVLGFCIITNTIGSLQAFDQIYVTTQGGPGFSTETLVKYIYSRGFTSPYELGYASTISILLLIVILVISFPMYKEMFFKEMKND